MHQVKSNNNYKDPSNRNLSNNNRIANMFRLVVLVAFLVACAAFAPATFQRRYNMGYRNIYYYLIIVSNFEYDCSLLMIK